jgi:hypothetical protein
VLVIGLSVPPLDTATLQGSSSPFMAAALVGSPIAGLADDSTAVSVQQFVARVQLCATTINVRGHTS